MRAPVLALFDVTAREADDGMRARLAARLGGHGDLPLDLVNDFYLCAPKSVRREILMRNELDLGAFDDGGAAPDAAELIAAARDVRVRDFAQRLGDSVGIAARTARAVLADASGEALAVLCRGAHLDRAAFSALALLKIPTDGDPLAQLAAYDGVPQRAAGRLTQHWRTHQAPHQHLEVAAAE
ncbi:MAG: hypothetical protein KJS68_13405, partial [Alphaproteobacteria bacterium]|nr:hypothetical protein [Alphaproteobacteria bacterium]